MSTGDNLSGSCHNKYCAQNREKLFPDRFFERQQLSPENSHRAATEKHAFFIRGHVHLPAARGCLISEHPLFLEFSASSTVPACSVPSRSQGSSSIPNAGAKKARNKIVTLGSGPCGNYYPSAADFFQPSEIGFQLADRSLRINFYQVVL